MYWAAVTLSPSLSFQLVLSAIVAQFPTIDQYRWPGWFTFVHAVVLIVIVVCFMHEKWTDLKRASPGKWNCKQVVPQRLPQIPVQPIVSLCVCVYVCVCVCVCVCAYVFLSTIRYWHGL